MGESAEKDGQTLLVPTNAAFDKLPEDLNGRLLADKEFAQKVVQRHILDEVLTCTIYKNVAFAIARFSAALALQRTTSSSTTRGEELGLDKFR